MENKLLCPFCGAEAKPWDTNYGVVSVVECKGCKTRFLFPYWRKGRDLAVFWNKRKKEDAKCAKM